MMSNSDIRSDTQTHSPVDNLESNCTNRTFSTIHRRAYTLYCGYYFPDNDASEIQTSTFSACLDECTTSTNPGCFAVNWKNDTGTCFKKSDKASMKDIRPFDIDFYFAAMASRDQLPTDPRGFMCPYENLNIRNSSYGRKYKVQCGASYDQEPLRTVHASSMDDCMMKCDLSKPLCSYITYHIDPSQSGWYNCHLRSSALAKPKPKWQTAIMAHSAVAVSKLSPTGQCRAGTAVSINNRRYLVSCNDQRLLNDTNARPVSFHEDSLEHCTTRCRSLNTICSAMVFDATMASGYMNCHLFSVLPPSDTSHTDYTFLYSEELAANYMGPPHNPSEKRLNWILIVVPVSVGLIWTIVVTVYLYKCRFSRKTKKKAM